MLKRCVILAGLVCPLLTALAWTIPGAAAAGAKSAGTAPVCGPAGAHTLAADAKARVYSRNGSVYGCAKGAPKSFRLGSTSNSTRQNRVGPLALAGVDAAYGLTNYGVDTVSAEVLVRQLSDGHLLRRQNAVAGNLPAEYFESVDAIVLKPDGSVAWTAHGGSIVSDKSSVTEVEKSDRSSRTLLDKSSRIKTGSLRLQGSRLSWRDGATTRSATLQ
jgi:hypothetical protein